MKISKALKLVGKYPIVEGFWRNISMTIGLCGTAVFIFITATRKVPLNWLTLSLLFILVTMTTLPIYLPKGDGGKK